jgi:hypothetical protein
VQGDLIQEHRVAYVLGLTKEQLRAEIFRLDSELLVVQVQLRHIDNRVEALTSDYKELVGKNQTIIDKLLEDKLYKEPPRAAEPSAMEPMNLRRPNWGKIRTDYEQRKKKEFWEDRIKEIEERDKRASGGEGTQTSGITESKE